MTALGVLIRLKLRIAGNFFRKLRRRSRWEFLTLIVFLTGTGLGLFLFFLHSFRFFQGQKPFGPVLIDESFYLFNFMIFVMLLVSSGISGYASLFKSPEIAYLRTHPVSWRDLYFMKLLETLWISAWPLLFLIVPFLTAFSMTRPGAAPFFPLFCFLFYAPFLLLAVMLGVLASVLCVWLLPTRQSRRTALFLILAGAAALFFRVQPQVIQEQGSLAGILSGYLPHVALAKHPFAPSAWITRGILAFGQIGGESGTLWKDGLFYFQMLAANTLFMLLPSLAAGERLFGFTFLRAQDHGTGPSRQSRSGSGRDPELAWYERWRGSWNPLFGLMEKDLKTFRRDPSEWSQLILFFGLLLLYFLNLRNFQVHVLKDLWKNLFFVLNTVGTYLVLSSFSGRFIFPMLSLEGSRAWILALAPVSFATVLVEKFILGTLISILLTLPLVFLSGWMLAIEPVRILFATGLGLFVCIALTGLSVGFGALFPNFKSNNPSEIIAGLGGSLVLLAHLLYLAAVGAFLALVREPSWTSFLLMAWASLLVGTIPLQLGRHRLSHLEF